MEYGKLIFEGQSEDNTKKINKLNNYIGQLNENSTGLPFITNNNNENQDSQNQQSQQEEEDKQLQIHYLSTKFKELNSQLESFGFQKIGDPLQPTPENLKQTYELIMSMLQQRQQDQDIRQQFFEYKQQYSKKEQENYKQMKQLKQDLDKQTEINAKISQKLKNYQEDIKRKIDEKDLELKEIKQNYNQILNREVQFQNDLKKKDLSVKSLQEHIKRLQDKNVTLKHNQLIENLQDQQQHQVKAADFSQFQQLIGQQYQEIQRQLLNENETLREGLKLVHQELNDMLVIRQKIYLRRKKLAYGANFQEQDFNEEEELQDYNLLPFRKELFNMPMNKNGDQAILILQENVGRFREFMAKIDDLQNEMELESTPTEEEIEQIDKIKSIKNLKGLLQNYKKVVETQDNLLSMAIDKQDDFQNSAINLKNLETSKLKFSKLMDDEQLEQTRQYLCEQKKILENKDKEINQSKSILELTKIKIEHEKQQLLARKQESEQEAELFKEKVLNLVDQNIQDTKDLNSNVIQQIKQNQTNNHNQDKIEIETQQQNLQNSENTQKLNPEFTQQQFQQNVENQQEQNKQHNIYQQNIQQQQQQNSQIQKDDDKIQIENNNFQNMNLYQQNSEKEQNQYYN